MTHRVDRRHILILLMMLTALTCDSRIALAQSSDEMLQRGLVETIAKALERQMDREQVLHTVIEYDLYKGPKVNDAYIPSATDQPEEHGQLGWSSGKGRVLLDHAPGRNDRKRLELWTGDRWVRWLTDADETVIVRAQPRIRPPVDCFAWFNATDWVSVGGMRSIPEILRTGTISRIDEHDGEIHIRVLPYPKARDPEQEPLELVIERSPVTRLKSLHHEIHRALPDGERQLMLRTSYLVDEWSQQPGLEHLPMEARRVAVQFASTPGAASSDGPFGATYIFRRKSLTIEKWQDEHEAHFALPDLEVGREVYDVRRKASYVVGSHEVVIDSVVFRTRNPLPAWPETLSELEPDQRDTPGEDAK